MAARYSFKFIAVQSDGDIYDPDFPKEKQPTLFSLGKDGWYIAGIISGSAHAGFSHTLIMQQRVEAEYSRDYGYTVEGNPT